MEETDVWTLDPYEEIWGEKVVCTGSYEAIQSSGKLDQHNTECLCWPTCAKMMPGPPWRNLSATERSRALLAWLCPGCYKEEDNWFLCVMVNAAPEQI